MSGVSLVIPLGSHPGPFFSTLWALHEAGLPVEEAWVVLSSRGKARLDDAMTRHWQQLATALGGAPARSALHLVETAADDGSVDATRAIGEALWQAMREATRLERPVVCALGAGRHRTVASLAATVFSFRGRQRDRLIDLRYASKELEADTGFLFPSARGSGQVHLEDVPVPLLRRALGEELRPHSFESALTLGQRTIDALVVPELVVDLSVPRLTLDEEEVPLQVPSVLWVAFLAERRLREEDDGWVQLYPSRDEFIAFLARVKHHPWAAELKPGTLADLFAGDTDDDRDGEAFRKLRSRAQSGWKRHVTKRFFPQRLALLTETRKKDPAAVRLPLDPARIRIAGLPDHRSNSP